MDYKGEIKLSKRDDARFRFFKKSENGLSQWIRKRDGYIFDNEEVGLALDHYFETGEEP